MTNYTEELLFHPVQDSDLDIITEVLSDLPATREYLSDMIVSVIEGLDSGQAPTVIAMIVDICSEIFLAHSKEEDAVANTLFLRTIVYRRYRTTPRFRERPALSLVPSSTKH